MLDSGTFVEIINKKDYNYIFNSSSLRSIEPLAEAEKTKVISFTFKDLKNKFISSKLKVNKVSNSSIKAYKSTFNKLIKHFKDKSIESITTDEFEAFRDSLSKKCQAKC